MEQVLILFVQVSQTWMVEQVMVLLPCPTTNWLQHSPFPTKGTVTTHTFSVCPGLSLGFSQKF